MHSTTLTQAWVKNVHSLWAQGVVNRANLYTGMYKTLTQGFSVWVKAPSFTQFIHTFPPRIYTPDFTLITDTSYRYPHFPQPLLLRRKDKE